MNMQLNSLPNDQSRSNECFSSTAACPRSISLDRDDNGGLPIDEWLDVLARSGAELPFYHPDYIRHEMNAREPGRKAPALMLMPGDASESDCGAVLVPRTICGPLSFAARRHEMAAYYLAGGRFFGNESTANLPRLLEMLTVPLTRGSADLVYVEDVETNSPMWFQLLRIDPSRGLWFLPAGIQPRLKIRIPERPLDYWNSFSSKTRNTFRRKQKKFGDATIVRVTKPEQVADFVRHAHDVSQQTWQSRQLGLRIQNNESQAETLRVLARRGALRSYLLIRGETPIAFLIGNQSQGTFRYEEVGYDPQFADLSPGTVLLLHALEDILTSDPPEWFDFGAGDAGYKRLFANTRTNSGTVWLLRPGLESQFLVSTIALSHFGKVAMRAVAGRFGVQNTIRRLRRYGLGAAFNWNPVATSLQ